MKTIRRLRWWHTVAFCAVLLLITAISHAVRSPDTHTSQIVGPADATRATQANAHAKPKTPARNLPHAASRRWTLHPTAHDRRVSHPAEHRGRHGSRSRPQPGRTYRYAAAGIPLPNARRTPGTTNPLVTPANIHSTICVSGYTATIRPDTSYTTALKVRQLDTGYNNRGDTSTTDYEEDHLISLELGGSPTSPKNLWPEPYAGREGARTKDAVENKLHDLVCSGQVALRVAQRAIARNWWQAYNRYIGVDVTSPPRPHHRYRPPPPPAHTQSSPAHSCTTTSSGNCIRGGEFCPQADYGQTGYDANGTVYTCTGDTEHPHWE